jgi:hypothetical protein
VQDGGLSAATQQRQQALCLALKVCCILLAAAAVQQLDGHGDTIYFAMVYTAVPGC